MQLMRKGEMQHQRFGKANLRLIILLGLFILVGSAFLYDKFVLLPSAHEKTRKVVEDVTLSLNVDNRKDVEQIVGISAAKEFKHNDLDVVQYRFPRGLPFYPKPMLDVAYRGGAIVHVRTSELTPEILDSFDAKRQSANANAAKRNKDEKLEPVGQVEPAADEAGADQ